MIKLVRYNVQAIHAVIYFNLLPLIPSPQNKDEPKNKKRDIKSTILFDNRFFTVGFRLAYGRTG